MIRRFAWLGVVLLGVAGAAGAAPEKKPADGKPKDDAYELYKVFADVMDQVERNYVKEVDRRELVEAAIRGMLTKLDPYSSYVSPAEMERFRAGVESEFGGIGIQISLDEGQLTIISPLAGTPGYRAGLLAGDRIVEIDGKPTDGLSLDEAVERLKGPEGTSVTLTVMHVGRTGRERITVTREKIHVETVLGDRRKGDDAWDFMLRPKERIGYVRVTAFSRDTVAELRRAVEQLQREKMRALILDLRFNPGGLLTAAIEASDLFVAAGRIVSTNGRNSPERVWNAQKDGTFEGFPMVVLVNRYSASASEIVAACLQDHQRAAVLGERTWGKGSVQNVIELENGHSALKLTTAAYRRPSGQNIHRFEGAKDGDQWGVTPDKGLEVKLGDSETIGLLAYRRRRDVLRPAENGAAKPTKPAPEGTAPPGDAPKGETPRTEPPKDAPPADAPKGNGAQGDANAEKPEAEPPDFVDRQLEAAVKHLSAELAKAK